MGRTIIVRDAHPPVVLVVEVALDPLDVGIEFEPHAAEPVIDHLGHPLEAGSEQEYSIIEKWGGFPNTIIKLSNLGVISDHPDPGVKPYVNQMIKAYGPDRVIWGSDHKTGSTPEIYREKLDYAMSFLAEFSKEDKDKVFGGNAFRLFGKGWN